MHLRRRRILLVTLSLVAVLGLGAVGASMLRSSEGPAIPKIAKQVMVDPRPSDPFKLVDDNNRPFDGSRFSGRWTFMFIGYTHCPDICPTTLTMMQQLKQQLQQNHVPLKDFQVVFVSVDPKRDPPAHLAEYVHYFDPQFVGATGHPDQILVLEHWLGAFHHFERPDASGAYTVNHSSYIYLVDPQGRLFARFAGFGNPKSMADRYVALRDAYRIENRGHP